MIIFTPIIGKMLDMKNSLILLLIISILLALSCEKNPVGDNSEVNYDIFVAGLDNHRACYWKNGTKVSLSSLVSYATSIAISGTDIFIAVCESNNTTTNACYWKNDTKISLSSSLLFSHANF